MTQQIDIRDYFEVLLLDGKEGHMSSDCSAIRFGNYIIKTNDCFDEVEKLDKFIGYSLKPDTISATVLKVPEGGVLYWCLALSHPASKEQYKLNKKKFNVSVISSGEVA